MRRTGFAVLITAGLVALFSGVYYDMEWAGRYLFFALWALGFHALFPLIFKAMMDRKRGLGMILIGLKVCMLAMILVVIEAWPFPEGPARRPQVLAMLIGVSTPLLVLMLRVLGFMMELAKKTEQNREAMKNSKPDDNPPNGELRPNS